MLLGGARRPCFRRHGDTRRGPRHRVRRSGTVCPAGRQADFSRLPTGDVSQSCEARSWRCRSPLRTKDTDRRPRRAEFLSAFNSRLFCAPLFNIFFCLKRDKNTATDSPRRSHARPGLEFPRWLRKSLYRKQDHASVSAASALPPCDGRSGNAVPGFHRSLAVFNSRIA